MSTKPLEASPAAPALPESGIVPKVPEMDGDFPAWSVVAAYLARGEHREWVEAYAARSRAFGEVLAALRNDHDERAEGGGGAVLRFRAGRGAGAGTPRR